MAPCSEDMTFAKYKILFLILEFRAIIRNLIPLKINEESPNR